MKKILTHPLSVSFLIIITLFLIDSRGYLKEGRGVFLRLTQPFQHFFYEVFLKAHYWSDYGYSLNRLNVENTKLKEENKQLLAELVRLKEVVQENHFLRQQLGLEQKEFRKLILARVIGGHISSLERHFLINKGEKEGVVDRAAVITAGNILIGQVIETMEHTALVQLITDPNSRVNGLIQESRLKGIVREEDGDLVIDLLPQGGEIREGQEVVTSGSAGLFPAGLFIGQIKEVVSLDVQIVQKAKLKPAPDFDKIERVFVLKKQ